MPAFAIRHALVLGLVQAKDLGAAMLALVRAGAQLGALVHLRLKAIQVHLVLCMEIPSCSLFLAGREVVV